MKYKNKDGIELNYSGNDIQSTLTKEVVEEAIKILNMYDRSCKISMGYAMTHTKNFLTEKFDLNRDKWRVEQYNRNRAPEDQVSNIKEMKEKLNGSR